MSPRLGPPLAYIYPVPPRAQGRRRRVRDCRTVPGAGREPAELGEGKQGPRPLPSPRGRAPAARAAAGTFPLPALLPRWTPAQPWRGGCPRPQPAPLALGLRTFYTHLERVSPAPPKNCLICAKPPRPGAEHAAPACRARVHPAQRGGDRAEAVAPGRCLGPDRLHVSPARGHVHRLSPVRRPDVLRINKMKLGETGGQKAPGPPNPHPRPLDLLSAPVSRRSPSALPCGGPALQAADSSPSTRDCGLRDPFLGPVRAGAARDCAALRVPTWESLFLICLCIRIKKMLMMQSHQLKI